MSGLIIYLIRFKAHELVSFIDTMEKYIVHAYVLSHSVC